MQYLGGKHRKAKRIATALLAARGTRKGRVVIPFAGGLSDAAALAAALGDERDRLEVSDGSEALVGLYAAWRAGWRPPPCNAERYTDLRVAWKAQGDLSPEVVFAGIALSFGGKWMAGFARAERGQDSTLYYDRALRSIDRKMGALDGIPITCRDFRTVTLGPEDAAYADPPYEGTQGYPIAPPWPGSKIFWGWAQTGAEAGAAVLVSEYKAPGGWEGVPFGGSLLGVSTGARAKTDHLWSYTGGT